MGKERVIEIRGPRLKILTNELNIIESLVRKVSNIWKNCQGLQDFYNYDRLMTAMKKRTLAISVILILPLVLTQCTDGKGVSDSNPKEDFKVMREKMVETQIKARGVKDPRVLSALLKVERHRFVPEKYLDSSYSDQPLPIGEGQTISQPYIVALMTELLELKGNEKVLEIGTGSGYQGAVLSLLAAEVFTVERIETIALKTQERFRRLKYTNIHVVV